MGVNITTIVYIRVLIIQIGWTSILMVVEAQGNPFNNIPYVSSIRGWPDNFMFDGWWVPALGAKAQQRPVLKKKFHSDLEVGRMFYPPWN